MRFAYDPSAQLVPRDYHGPKILTWISLWMRVLDRARHRCIQYNLEGQDDEFFGPHDASNVAHLADLARASLRLKYLLLRRRDLVAKLHGLRVTDRLHAQWVKDLYESMFLWFCSTQNQP
jgi:hypothetical protein